MSESWTIGRLLEWTADFLGQHGADTPRLDAEVLLAEAHGCERIDLYARFNELAEEETRVAFRELVRRRSEGMPVAYLVGRREFYSLSFRVSPDVLVPRPETELLVMTLLDLAKEFSDADGPLQIADIGTGSGIIAVCAAKYLPQSQLTAVDISPAALAVAARNATDHGVVDRIDFVEGDLFSAVPEDRKFHFVASNPPYISTDELEALMPEVRDHEPRLALAAGAAGTDVIERLVPQAAERLRVGGTLLIEISPMIQQAVIDLIIADGRYKTPSVAKDLSGNARLVTARRIG
jgi:release factor glutamine methyltransferase